MLSALRAQRCEMFFSGSTALLDYFQRERKWRIMLSIIVQGGAKVSLIKVTDDDEVNDALEKRERERERERHKSTEELSVINF